MSKRDATGEEIHERLHEMGGKVEEEELVYTLSKRGMRLRPELVADLEERGLVRRQGTSFEAIVPPRDNEARRVDVRNPAIREQDVMEGRDQPVGWTDEELMDRVKLWALIVGTPPTQAAWNPTRLQMLIDRLQERADAHRRIMAMFQAGDWPTNTTVRDRFGSLNAALVICGFEARAPGRQPVEPDAPRPVRKPKYGPEALEEARQRVTTARAHVARGKTAEESGLRDALYDLAVAAFTEADRL